MVDVTPATLPNIDALIQEAGWNGTVRFLPGVYQRSKPIVITNPFPDGMLYFRAEEGVICRSNRAEPWAPGLASGNKFFQIASGRQDWSGPFRFERIGNGCFQLGVPASFLYFDGMTATNFGRFITNEHMAGQTEATLTHMSIANMKLDAWTKGTIKLQYGTNDVVIENVVGDSQSLDGDNFAEGIHLSGTVHDVIHSNVTMKNAVDTLHAYWNADGFASEEQTYNLTYNNCRASGCTDAGFDLKGQDHTLNSCVAIDNKRNFRGWGRVTLNDFIGLHPNLRGGTGTQAQIHGASDAVIHINRGYFADCDPRTIVFDADGNSIIDVNSADIWHHRSSPLITKETNADVLLGQAVERWC